MLLSSEDLRDHMTKDRTKGARLAYGRPKNEDLRDNMTDRTTYR